MSTEYLPNQSPFQVMEIYWFLSWTLSGCIYEPNQTTWPKKANATAYAISSQYELISEASSLFHDRMYTIQDVAPKVLIAVMVGRVVLTRTRRLRSALALDENMEARQNPIAV